VTAISRCRRPDSRSAAPGQARAADYNVSTSFTGMQGHLRGTELFSASFAGAPLLCKSKLSKRIMWQESLHMDNQSWAKGRTGQGASQKALSARRPGAGVTHRQLRLNAASIGSRSAAHPCELGLTLGQTFSPKQAGNQPGGLLIASRPGWFSPSWKTIVGLAGSSRHTPGAAVAGCGGSRTPKAQTMCAGQALRGGGRQGYEATKH